jgi:hypothetical protein
MDVFLGGELRPAVGGRRAGREGLVERALRDLGHRLDAAEVDDVADAVGPAGPEEPAGAENVDAVVLRLVFHRREVVCLGDEMDDRVRPPKRTGQTVAIEEVPPDPVDTVPGGARLRDVQVQRCYVHPGSAEGADQVRPDEPRGAGDEYPVHSTSRPPGP